MGFTARSLCETGQQLPAVNGMIQSLCFFLNSGLRILALSMEKPRNSFPAAHVSCVCSVNVCSLYSSLVLVVDKHFHLKDGHVSAQYLFFLGLLKSRFYLQNWETKASRLNIADFFSAGLSRAASLDEQNSSYFKKTPLLQLHCWLPC